MTHIGFKFGREIVTKSCFKNMLRCFRSSLIVVVLLYICHDTNACKGFGIKITSFKNCGTGKHVIRLTDNSTLTFDKNCDVTISGCIEIDAFSAGAAKYTIWKNHFQTSEGQFDVCDELKKYHLNANARHFLEHARIPRQCPVTKSEVCGVRKINIEQLAKFFPLAIGPSRLQIKIVHDHGRSCFDSELEVFPNFFNIR